MWEGNGYLEVVKVSFLEEKKEKDWGMYDPQGIHHCRAT